MDLHQLRVFAMAARYGTFTRAARELELSQPAVSAQIQTLEDELGVKLMERLPRQVLLTPAGELLLGYAGRLLDLEEEANLALHDLKGRQAGCLRVAASPTIGTFLLPEMLGQLRQSHPALRVIVQIEPSQRVADLLRDHAADLGLVEAPVQSPSLTCEPFCTDELALVVPADHPWASRGSIRPVELPEYPLIAREPESGTRRLVEERLRAVDVEIVPAIELGGVGAIKNAVLAGLGVAFISRHAIGREEKLGLLRALGVEGLDLRRSFYYLCPAHRNLSPTIEAFLSFVQQQPCLA